MCRAKHVHPIDRTATRVATIVLCAWLLAAPAELRAGAWTPAQGSAYNKLALNLFYGGSSFGRTPSGFQRFTDLDLTYYGEYGLRDDLALLGSLPLKSLTQTQDGHTTRFRCRVAAGSRAHRKSRGRCAVPSALRPRSSCCFSAIHCSAHSVFRLNLRSRPAIRPWDRVDDVEDLVLGGGATHERAAQSHHLEIITRPYSSGQPKLPKELYCKGNGVRT